MHIAVNMHVERIELVNNNIRQHSCPVNNNGRVICLIN